MNFALRALENLPMELLSTVLTSAVVSACLTGLFTLQSSERKIQIENITQERAKWRERIRSNGLLVHKAAVAHEAASLAELSFVFQLLLNPHDSEDKLIIRCIDDLKSASDLTPKLSEFTSRLSFY
ncbi:MAG: hypothetical protein IPH54_16105 [Rhodoferax sp.]|nr:hypothetical protein [Rhodoferax sp.]